MSGPAMPVDAYNGLRACLKDDGSFERYYVHRDGALVADLFPRLMMDKGHEKHLVVGLRGCGKTTELKALLRAMEGTHFGVYISLLDGMHTANVTEGEVRLLELLGLLSRAVGTGLDIGEKRSIELTSWLVSLLPERNRPTEGMDGLVDATRAVRTALRLLRPREAIAVRLEEDHISLSERLDHLIALVEKEDGRRVLIAMDDLDKMDPKPATALFRDNHGQLNAPRCQCVLTVPYITARSRDMRSVRGHYGHLHFLGALPLEGPNASGSMGLLRDIVSKRVPNGSIEDAAIDKAIEASGGVPGDMLRLLAEAHVHASYAGGRVTVKDVDDAMKGLALEARRHLTGEELAVLAKLDTGKATSEVLQELVRDGYVIEYNDEEGIYRPHPIVRTLL